MAGLGNAYSHHNEHWRKDRSATNHLNVTPWKSYSKWTQKPDYFKPQHVSQINQIRTNTILQDCF